MKRITKSEMIRARCDAALKQDLEQIAVLKKLDVADIVRIACDGFVQQIKSQSLFSTNNYGRP